MTPGDSISTTAMFVDVFLKLGVVLLLIYGGLIVVRRLQIRKNPFHRKNIHILETSHLSPHRSLHLIQVGKEAYLIGATDQNIHLLSRIDDPQIAEQITNQPAENETAAFQMPPFAAVLLENLTRRKPQP
ncbi:MAG: flagellar biosynthetic protein FliO [Chloroflexota bacterium]